MIGGTPPSHIGRMEQILPGDPLHAARRTYTRAPMGTSTAETWDAFFSDFYLRAYSDDARQDEAEGQALAAARLARCPAGGALLDVPCGFGRHAVPLAAAGYAVTGVDRSGALLDAARDRAAAAGTAPDFVEGDYRQLPFADATFDAALNLFTSLGYLGDEEDTRVLAEIGRVLRPGGHLVVETMHRDAVVRGFADRAWRLVGAGRLLLEQRTFDPRTGVVQETQTLVGPAGERDSRPYSLRVYTATELMAMLTRAGFDEVRPYGGMDGEPLTADSRLVLVARR
jgi:SAM-dependent methyltransferase